MLKLLKPFLMFIDKRYQVNATELAEALKDMRNTERPLSEDIKEREH